jgi:hypothetical protein
LFIQKYYTPKSEKTPEELRAYNRQNRERMRKLRKAQQDAARRSNDGM